MAKNSPLALAFNACVIAFMLAPLLIVCAVAFTPENTLTIPSTHLSLRWFKAVFAHADLMQSFWNSLWLALSAATLATLVAVPAGLAITRHAFAGRDALNALFLSPLVIPHLVLGIAILRSFSLIGATGSFGWLVLAHVVIVTSRDAIADETSMVTHQGINRRLSAQGIHVKLLSQPLWSDAFENGELEITQVYTGEKTVIRDVAFFAYSTPRAPAIALAAPLRAAGIDVQLIGDCLAPRTVMAATAEGHAAGHAV